MTRTTKQSGTKAGTLGDAELMLLASGGQSPDRVITAPATLKAVTRQRAAANLIRRGLAEERPAGAGETAWREDGEERVVLVATAAGLAAIGIEDGSSEAGTQPDGQGRSGSTIVSDPAATDPVSPRPGSKGELVVTLLSRGSGASLDELIAATGWLPHTTRAALTGLRKRGFAVDRQAGPEGSRYRIAQPEPAKPTRRGRRKSAAAKAA